MAETPALHGKSSSSASVYTTEDDHGSLLDILEGSRKRQEGSSGDWGDYMKTKRRKLNDQFQNLDVPSVSSIFKGVTIYVNGWTQPIADDLKEMIHSHGGHYEYNLYSKSRVTHTIATNLPNVKINNPGRTVVCTPAWIVDSIAADRRLPVDKYLLYSRGGAQQQLVLEEVRESPPQDQQLVLEELRESPPQDQQLVLEELRESPPQDQQLVLEELRESPPQDEQDAEDLTSGSDELFPEPDSISEAGSSECSEADSITDGQQGTSVVKAYQSSEGAEFVNSFFTHSRLHYLSTWSMELKQFTAKMLRLVSPRYPLLPARDSLRGTGVRAVVHIDLDCFFVSVSIRNKPHLKGKAVAVTHAKLPKTGSESKHPTTKDSIPKHLLDSTSDIASCSYAARDVGVKNGMSVGEAIKLCPDLIPLSYDFEAYREVSQCFYEILLQYSSCVEAVSCDEAFIELTDYVSGPEQVEDLVLKLRSEVESKVGCTVSAGVAHNMLLARMCTRIAKPNGQFYLPLISTGNFLESQTVNNLPGVGYSTTRKLREMSIETCSQLRTLSLEKLQNTFGNKTGKSLHDFARGIDERELKTETERKSVSVDINYGIRFKNMSEAESLISNLATELEKRSCDAGVVGGTVTLKMKIRQASAPKETWKYLGHGACNNVTRSLTLLQPTRSAGEMTRLALRLLKQVGPVASDIRGMGLQLSKLVLPSSEGSYLGMDMRAFLKPMSDQESRPTPPPLEANARPKPTLTNFFREPPHAAKDSAPIDLPPLSQLDNSVLNALPELLKDEILHEYASKQAKEVETTTPNEELTPPKDLLDSDRTLGVIITNESLFLRDIRRYIQDWILHYIEGPPEEDVAIFSDYLIKLSTGNLDVTSQALKAMRRLTLKLELISWYPVFNLLLENVEQCVGEQYSGHLDIPPI